MVDRAVPRRTYWVRLVRYDWNHALEGNIANAEACMQSLQQNVVSNAADIGPTGPVLQNLHGRQLVSVSPELFLTI